MKRASAWGLSILCLACLAVAQQLPPWSVPVNLGSPVNTTLAEFQPAISPDGRSLYFIHFGEISLTDSNTGDMWVAHRATTDTSWSMPEKLPPTINVSLRSKATPFISADGHRMYFASNRTGTLGRNDLFVSFRNSVTADSGPDGWQTPVNLGANVNSASGLEQMGCIFTDEATGTTTLLFNSDRGGNQDIYASTLQLDGVFGPAVPVAELNTPFIEQHPICSRDGLELYFTSTRPGSNTYPSDFSIASLAGQISEDLWVSTRASTSDPWQSPKNVDEFNVSLGGGAINSPFHDGRAAISSDNTELYFFSAFRGAGQPGGNLSDNFDVWVSTRPDTTPPNAPTAHISPAPNASAWNNTDVTVSFTSNGDPGHIATGIAECTSDITVTAEASGTVVNGTCTDRAGNVSEPSTATVSVDKTPPVVELTGVRDGETYTLGSAPLPVCRTSDALSGVASAAALVVSGGNSDSVGVFTATCSSAVDVAGNVAPTVAATYTVAFAFSGFQPPLSASGFSGSFKIGSTVPVKWQLHDALGRSISSTSTIDSLAVLYLGDCSNSGNTGVPAQPTGHSVVRYDNVEHQFVFNWQTKGLSPGCYVLNLSLDDTTKHSTMLILE